MYNDDVQFRLSLTPSARFDTADTTLFMTILNSSAVRKEGVSCQRCKSPNHLVCDCFFRAKPALEENQSTKKPSSRQRPDQSQQTSTWKYKKYFTSTGKEGCNLFQRNSCQQGTECKRAHVCKACRGSTLWPIVNMLPDINSPFHIDTSKDCLSHYPDRSLANDLLHDIHFGVNIGFSGTRYCHVYDNHFSATTNPKAVARELERELSLHRKIGPFLTPPFTNFVESPMGAIPKKRLMPMKWCIIHDLSWPAAHSVNDGIPKEPFPCTYDTLDRAISQLKLNGQGALMSKLDLSDAFRHILVRREDWELLGSTWQVDINDTTTTAYFVDAFLPFGLRSSPALFLKYVDILSFTIQDRGASPSLERSGLFLDVQPPCPRPPLPNQLRYHARYLCRSRLQFKSCKDCCAMYYPRIAGY